MFGVDASYNHFSLHEHNYGEYLDRKKNHEIKTISQYSTGPYYFCYRYDGSHEKGRKTKKARKPGKKRNPKKTKQGANNTNQTLRGGRKKKRSRRKKNPNGTVVHYYDNMGASDEEWMKFISYEDILKFNKTYNSTTMHDLLVEPKVNLNKIAKRRERKLNKTNRGPTTKTPNPYRLKRRSTKPPRSLKNDEKESKKHEESSYKDDYTSQEKSSYVDVHKSHKDSEYEDKSDKLKSYDGYKSHTVSSHNDQDKSDEESGNPNQSHKESIDVEYESHNERSYEDHETHKGTIDKSHKDNSSYKRDPNRSQPYEPWSGDDLKRGKKRRPRAVKDEQETSDEISYDSGTSDSTHTTQKKDTNTKYSTIYYKKKFTQGVRKNKQQTISIQEAKERRLMKKGKLTTTTTKKSVPDFIMQKREDVKKAIGLSSDEWNREELIANPKISTKYAVDTGDIKDIQDLLGSLNNTNNEKLFLDLMKDLEETGTVKQDLYREVEKVKYTPEKSTKLNITPSPSTTTTTEAVITRKVEDTPVKTRRTKARTTFPLYVDAFGDREKTVHDTRQTKKLLRSTLTVKKKSIHELLGITRKPPSSEEVLKTEEREEFLHDAYFDYGVQGPVKKDIIVTSTPKREKTTRLKIARLITTDFNEVEEVKKKKKDLDLKHMLGSDAEYYDQMKKIMDEKTIGDHTKERYMEERLIRKYADHLKTENTVYKDDATTFGTTNLLSTYKSKSGITDCKKNAVGTDHTTQSADTASRKHTTCAHSDTISADYVSGDYTSGAATEYFFPDRNPLFDVRLPEVKKTNVVHKDEGIEDEIQNYNKELIGEEDGDAPPEIKPKRREINIDGSSTMEQKDNYRKILEHYLVDDGDGHGPLSHYIKESKMSPIINTSLLSTHAKTVHVQTTLSTSTGQTKSQTTNKIKSEDRTHPKEIYGGLTGCTTTPPISSEADPEGIKKEILKQVGSGFEEVNLDTTSNENESDKVLSEELNRYMKEMEELNKQKNSSELQQTTQRTRRAKTTRDFTTLSSKEIEHMMQNKDQHFENVLGEYMKDKTEATRREILRGKSTKNYSPTSPRSKDTEWEITKNYCPVFMNQTLFDVECQKFIRIINKRGENQLQRLSFEMKTKNNPTVGKIISVNLLTANNFADIVKRTMKKPCDLANLILYKEIVPQVIDWQAEAKYKNLTGNFISKCGYFIDDKYPFLGVIPDGLIREEGMVRFVNTSTYPNINLKMILLRDKNLRGNFIVAKDISLAPEGSLMYEIQGALHVAKRQYCDLFVYNGNDHLLLKIKRDKDFWKSKMRKPLIDFYRNHMLPAVVKRILHRRYKVHDSYFLNSEEDLLSVIRGLKSDTTQQTLPTRKTDPMRIMEDHQSQENILDSRKFEEEEWNNLDKKTMLIPVNARTVSRSRDKLRGKEGVIRKTNRYNKNNMYTDSRTTPRKNEHRSVSVEKSDKKESEYNKNEESRRKRLERGKIEIKKKAKLESLKSLYETQERHRKNPKMSSLSSKDYSKEIPREKSKTFKKVNQKETSNEKYEGKERAYKKDKKYGSSRKKKVHRESSESSSFSSEESDQHKRKAKLKKMKIKSSKSSQESSKSVSRQKRRIKRVKRELQKGKECVIKGRRDSQKGTESSIKGRRFKREMFYDYAQLPRKGEKASSDDRITIENLSSYKDTEYEPDLYDPNKSEFKSLPDRVAKKKAEPDFLVDFYKKGLISKDEFLEIVKNKTREGKPWRRLASVESSQTFETENYSDLVKARNCEPLSGIKESITENPEDYDKDDVCKKYLGHIGYGRPVDKTLFNKSIVFTADDMKRIKQEKIEAKFKRAQAKMKLLGKTYNKRLRTTPTTTTEEAEKAKKVQAKINRKLRNNKTLRVADLSLGDEEIDEITKKTRGWKSTPIPYDMYNTAHRAERRHGFRRQYRLYWENLEKLKRLYPSAESGENPDAKRSDRFYRGLKLEGDKTKTWEYTSVRDCFHSYSTEFKEEQMKRKKMLKRIYANENTAEIVQRLGKRIARRKLAKNETISSEKLINKINELKELLKKKQRYKDRKRKRRSAPEEMDPNFIHSESSDDDDDSKVAEFKQDSEDTELKKLEKEADNRPRGTPRFILTTNKYEQDWSREKRRRAKQLKLRPKYAHLDSGSIEFILLKKELKKNGEGFSNLSVSISDENTTADVIDVDKDSRGGYYLSKQTTTIKDDDALMDILKEKSEEDKLLQNVDQAITNGDGQKDERIENSTTQVVTNNTEYSEGSITKKQKKKRGRPTKEKNFKTVKKRHKISNKTTTNAPYVRRKRALVVRNTGRECSMHSVHTSESESSEIRDKKEKNKHIDKKFKVKNEEHRKKIKKNRRSESDETSTESEQDSKETESNSLHTQDSFLSFMYEKRNHKNYMKDQKGSTRITDKTEENSSSIRGNTKRTHKEESDTRSQGSSKEGSTKVSLKNSKSKKRRKKMESYIKKESSEESGSVSHKKIQTTLTEKSSSSKKTRKKHFKNEKKTQEDSEHSDTSKRACKEKRKTQRSKSRKPVDHKVKSWESKQKSSRTSTVETSSRERSNSSERLRKTNKKLSRQQYKAEQRKLRRKRRKLLKKKMKRGNRTTATPIQTTLGDKVTKQTVYKNRGTVRRTYRLDGPDDPDLPYTPATIVVRYTKNPKQYKKLPTRDVESIFDHRAGNYKEFIREYNFRHACTPLGKKAIKKLEIIKEQEFNAKQVNRSEQRESIQPGFELYDSEDFENNVERKHKPWEESDQQTAQALRKSKKQTKKMPWDPEYKEDNTIEAKKQEEVCKSKDSLESDTGKRDKETKKIEEPKKSKYQKMKRKRGNERTKAKSKEPRTSESDESFQAKHTMKNKSKVVTTSHDQRSSEHVRDSEEKSEYHSSPGQRKATSHETYDTEGEKQSPRIHRTGSSGSYSGDYSAELSDFNHQLDKSASKIRREFWRRGKVSSEGPLKSDRSVDSKNDRGATTVATNRKVDRIQKHRDQNQKVLKREKRTPEATTQANVINMNPLLLMTGLSETKKKKTTKFRRGSRPWQSQEITSTTLDPFIKKMRKKLERIQQNPNR